MGAWSGARPAVTVIATPTPGGREPQEGTDVTHHHGLFHAFSIDDLAQQEKRRQLVALAFATGLVQVRDL